MDFERDYILRMIHMLGAMMRRLAERMDDAERDHQLDLEARKLCGMPLSTAETLDDASLGELLAPMPRFFMGELFYAKAKASTTLAYGQADALLLSALRLLASLHAEPRLCDLRAARLAELKADVFPLLTGDDLFTCARFFAQAEAYDQMEDALFQALALMEGEAWAHNARQGVRLLRSAAKATGQALALCGMTAEELRAAAHELDAALIKRTGGSA